MIPRAGDEGPGVSAGWTQGFSLGRRKSSADGVDGCPVRLTPELQGELRTLTSYTVENRRVIHSQFSMYMDPPILHVRGSPPADSTQPQSCSAVGTTFEKKSMCKWTVRFKPMSFRISSNVSVFNATESTLKNGVSV